MKTVYEQKGFGWAQLVIGILFILTALLAFRNPAGSLLALAVVFGAMAIVSGIGLVVYRSGGGLTLGIGVLEIVIGFLLLFNIGVTVTILAYLFAFWFILHSASNLATAKRFRFLGKGYYWLMLIVNSIGLLLGIVLLIDPILSALTLSFVVGLYFLLLGIGAILIAFSHPSIRIEIDRG